MSDLKVQNLRRTFGPVVALEDMSFDVNEGEFFCLLGPSSSGKTTTLRSIAGLENLDKGEVHFAGQNVTDAPVQGRGMSMIFQTFALYPHLSVEANFAHPLRRSGTGRHSIHIAFRLRHPRSNSHRTPHPGLGNLSGSHRGDAKSLSAAVQPGVYGFFNRAFRCR